MNTDEWVRDQDKQVEAMQVERTLKGGGGERVDSHTLWCRLPIPAL